MFSRSSFSSIRHLFAELLIIVAGVLIALGIDEWRENVENVRVERTYIQQLIVDLQATEDLMARAESTNAASEGAASKLIAAFAGREDVEPSYINVLLAGIRAYDNPVPILGAADALMTTGDLQLIRDPSARSAITQYLSYTRDYLLTPIYGVEDKHRDYFERIFALRVAHGLTPSTGEGAFERNVEPNVETFLTDDDAYVAVTIIVRLKRDFKLYRQAAAAAAKKLREQLENLPR